MPSHKNHKLMEKIDFGKSTDSKGVPLQETISLTKMVKIKESDESLVCRERLGSPDKLSVNKSQLSSIKASVSDIKPEEWNNIPFPLVDCINIIIRDLGLKDKTLEAHIGKFNEFADKTEFQRLRKDKEIERREEGYDNKLQRLDKNMGQMYNNQRKHVDNEVIKIKKKIENMELDTSSSINRINMTLARMEEASSLRIFIEKSIKESGLLLQQTIKNDIRDIKEKLIERQINSFLVPNLIGSDSPYESYEKFCIHLQEVTQSVPMMLESLESKLENGQVENKNLLTQELEKVK